MKNGVICLIVLSLVLGGRSLLMRDSCPEADTVEALLNSRIEIMSSFMYGEKNLYNLRNALSKIERDPVLQGDMDVLEMIMDNPTDFERALSVTVDEVTGVRHDDDYLIMDVVLTWVMLGNDGRYEVTGKYEVRCVNERGETYLSSLKHIYE